MLEKFIDSSKGELFYINGPDGKIRWLFPCGLGYPGFLALYNTSTLKGKVYAFAVRLLFLFGLKRLVSSGKISGRLNDRYASIVKRLGGDSYSVFMGTPGENRKIVLEVGVEGKTHSFVKIPTTDSAKTLVEAEKCNLDLLMGLDLREMTTPVSLLREDCLVAISSVRPSKYLNGTSFSDKHFLALKELYIKTHKTLDVLDIGEYLNASERVDFIAAFQQDTTVIGGNLLKNIGNGLLFLREQLREKRNVVCTFSHRDFTPWNLFVGEKGLCVYDWELAQENTPILYDVFHFFFQNGILVRREKYVDIKKQLNEELIYRKECGCFSDFEIDINVVYGFYLFSNVSYYVRKYIEQDDLHVQAHWLISTWEEALNDYVDLNGCVYDI